MIEARGEQITKPFYIRYYDTGIAASWPAPKGWAAPNGVSYGKYSIDDQVLIIHRGPDLDDIRVAITKLTDSKMMLGIDPSKKAVYKRITPDLKPVVEPKP